jgi:outer membrane receptor protein involved in Fe transport
VNFEYDLAPGILAYASYAHGFKAGGFNGQDTSPDQMAVPFGPEKVDAYELGLKTGLLDRRMILNVAVFRSEYTDLQVGGARPFVTSPAATVQNAGGARSQGIDISQRWAITRGLTSSLEIQLLDAKYTSYPNANATSYQAVLGIPRQDLTGARTPYSPKYSGNWSLTYEAPLTGDFNLHVGGSLYFTSRFNMTTNNDPFLDQAGYGKLDVSIGINNTKSNWDATLLVRNATDRLYSVYGAAAPTSLGSYSLQIDPLRSYTAQLRWHF